MAWRACVAQLFFCSTSVGSHSKTLMFDMVWRTCVAQRIFFIAPARGLIQKQFF